MIDEDYKQRLFTDTEFRNAVGNCPLCGQNVKDRTGGLYKSLINDLYKIYCWCGENRKHEFRRKEISHLLSKINYTRFADLVRFGGIVYRPKNDEGKSEKGLFGINMARAKEFFAGNRQIPVWITLNQLTNEIIEAKYATVNDFPELVQLLDEKGLYDYEKVKLF